MSTAKSIIVEVLPEHKYVSKGSNTGATAIKAKIQHHDCRVTC
jgi:hypothetical protein